MAFDKATLITSLQTAFKNSVGTDDDMLTVATAIANAIDTYAKTGKATGTDSGGDTHNLPLS